MPTRPRLWQQKAQTLKRYPPLDADHPAVATGGVRCPGCNVEFKTGDVITLIPIGPGDDEDARKMCQQGFDYNAVAIPAHWACVTGED